jgi:hypothetical protein
LTKFDVSIYYYITLPAILQEATEKERIKLCALGNTFFKETEKGRKVMFTKQKKCAPCGPSPLCGVLIGMLAAGGVLGAYLLLRRRLPMMARTVGEVMEKGGEAMKSCGDGCE